MLHTWMSFNKNNKNNISSLKLEHRFKTSCVKSAWEIANTSNFTTGSWPESHATIRVCSITDQQTHQLIYSLVIWNSDHKNISWDTAGSINSSAAYKRKETDLQDIKGKICVCGFVLLSLWIYEHSMQCLSPSSLPSAVLVRCLEFWHIKVLRAHMFGTVNITTIIIIEHVQVRAHTHTHTKENILKKLFKRN